MSQYLTPRDYLETKVEYYGAEASGLNNLRAIAAAEPKSFIYVDSKGQFAASTTKFHLFPGICETVQANAIFDLLKDQLRGGQTYNQVSKVIMASSPRHMQSFTQSAPDIPSASRGTD